jgi:hypothetical protein
MVNSGPGEKACLQLLIKRTVSIHPGVENTGRIHGVKVAPVFSSRPCDGSLGDDFLGKRQRSATSAASARSAKRWLDRSGPMGVSAHPQRQSCEVALEEVLTKERVLVHHAQDAAVVGWGEAHVGHLLALSVDRRLVDTMERKHPGDLVGEAVEKLRCWSQRYEHRKEGSSIDHQRHLRPPEQGGCEPVAKHARRDIVVDDRRTLHSIPELLRSSYTSIPRFSRDRRSCRVDELRGASMEPNEEAAL